MKVKELIKLLKEENPEAELYTHSGFSHADAFKLSHVKRGFSNNIEWFITHSEWDYIENMDSEKSLNIPIVILEEDV